MSHLVKKKPKNFKNHGLEIWFSTQNFASSADFVSHKMSFFQHNFIGFLLNIVTTLAQAVFSRKSNFFRKNYEKSSF